MDSPRAEGGVMSYPATDLGFELADGGTFTLSEDFTFSFHGTPQSLFNRWLDIRDSEDELAEFFRVLVKNDNHDAKQNTLSINDLEER